MSDTKLIFEQRRTIAQYAKHQKQLEQVCLAQNSMIEELVSVACGWAFDTGRGGPMMSPEQMTEVLTNYKQESAK